MSPGSGMSGWVRILLCGWVTSATLLAAVPGHAGSPSEQDRARDLYRRHCVACHGTGAVEALGPGRPVPPAFGQVGEHFRDPRPLAALLHHVVDPRRPGGSRVCGDRDAWWSSGDRGAPVRRRGSVLLVLRMLAREPGATD